MKNPLEKDGNAIFVIEPTESWEIVGGPVTEGPWISIIISIIYYILGVELTGLHIQLDILYQIVLRALLPNILIILLLKVMTPFSVWDMGVL